MRGRRPKTETLASLEGGYREGDFPVSRSLLPPDPPDWLRGNEVAVAEWRRVAPEMHERGLLSPRDIGTLALYCNIYSQYIAASLIIQADGLTVEGKGHPLLGKADALAKQFKAYAVELGFTPSSRGRIVLPPKDTPDDDEFERLASRS